MKNQNPPQNFSQTRNSSSDLSAGYDETRPQKYPQFDEELWPKINNPGVKGGISGEACSPQNKSVTHTQNKEEAFPKYPDAEQMELSFRTQSMESSHTRKDWLMGESLDLMGIKGIEGNKTLDGIAMTASVELPQHVVLNKRMQLMKEKEQGDLKKSTRVEKIEEQEDNYDLLDGDYRPDNVMAVPEDIKDVSPRNNEIPQSPKAEFAELIDIVKYERQVTEHDNFADDNALYHIHDLMTSSRHRGVQTDKKSGKKKSDLMKNNLVIRILESNSVKDGMFSTYIVYKILTKLQGEVEKEFIVTRRYRDFDALFEHLATKFQGHIIPILPPKSIKTTLQIESDEFYKTRKRELGAFLTNCVNHPFLRETDELEMFLTDQNGFYGIINKKDQGYFSWWSSDLFSNLFNTVSSAVKGDNTQTFYREKTNVDNELDNYENLFGSLGRRLQAYLQFMTKFLESKDKGIKVTASFALELESLKTKREDFQENKRQTTSVYSKNADVEKGYVASMLEKTETELKDIINSVESVNAALRRRNNYIRELYKLQEIVEIKSLKAKKNLASNHKLDELKSECNLWKEDLQKMSSTLLEEVVSYQTEITENINNFCQSIYQENKKCLEQSNDLWKIKS